MLTAAKLVETVPWIDAKYYAATQTMDEARHTEVFARYVDDEARCGVPDEPVPRGADHRAARGQPVGHRVPRHADRDREPRARGVRRHAAPDRRAAAAPAAALRARRRGAPRRVRRAEPPGALPRPHRGRAQGPPGVPRRGDVVVARAATTPEVWERMGVDVDDVRPHLRAAAGQGRDAAGHAAAGLLHQARAQRAQARPARRQPRLPPRALGRGRAAAVRVRRRHRLRLRVVRRGRPRSRRGALRSRARAQRRSSASPTTSRPPASSTGSGARSKPR